MNPVMKMVVLAAEYTTNNAAQRAHSMLLRAEGMRREPAGFDPSAGVPGIGANAEPTRLDIHPSGDWGAAGLIIERATHHLNESIPNGQRDRTSAALGALRIGVALLERALDERGVQADGPTHP